MARKQKNHNHRKAETVDDVVGPEIAATTIPASSLTTTPTTTPYLKEPPLSSSCCSSSSSVTHPNNSDTDRENDPNNNNHNNSSEPKAVALTSATIDEGNDPGDASEVLATDIIQAEEEEEGPEKKNKKESHSPTNDDAQVKKPQTSSPKSTNFAVSSSGVENRPVAGLINQPALEHCDSASFLSEDSSDQIRLPMIVSFSDGLRRKADIFDLGAWVKLSLILDGRDKITKVFQYTARFLAWSLLGSRQAERFEGLKKSLGTSRKAFRLGRTLVELHRIHEMGLLEVFLSHLKQHFLQGNDDDKDDNNEIAPTHQSHLRSRPLLRRVSTNIGLNYWNITDVIRRSPSIVRQFSRMSSRLFRSSTYEPFSDKKPFLDVLMTATKLLGLAIYWVGDNISFLTSSGFCDDFSVSEKERLSKQKQLGSQATTVGNRAYFVASVAGLILSWKNYRDFCHKTNKSFEESGEDCSCDFEKAKEKQFSLFLSLVKSCCDVLVFSNNPGIDLWKNQLGFPLNEGVHCVAGLVSASTVLCANYPSG